MVFHGAGVNHADRVRYMFKIRINPTVPQVRLWDTSDLAPRNRADDHLVLRQITDGLVADRVREAVAEAGRSGAGLGSGIMKRSRLVAPATLALSLSLVLSACGPDPRTGSAGSATPWSPTRPSSGNSATRPSSVSWPGSACSTSRCRFTA